jgi:LPS-assembly protein
MPTARRSSPPRSLERTRAAVAGSRVGAGTATLYAALLLGGALVADRVAAQSPSADPEAAVAPRQMRCPAPSSISGMQTPARPVPAPPAVAAPATDSQIRIASDRATLGVNGDARLAGNVRVTQGDRQLQADDVEYDAASSSFRVRGAVEYQDPVVRARGGNGQYSAVQGARFEGAEFEIPDRPARGTARDMTLDTVGTIRLQDVTFSTCPSDQPDWQIRARSIELDTRSREGTGRNAAVEFKGVPILYLPYISFPLGGQRMSGFLFPSIGSTTRSGAQVSVPWYWNAAPNLDLTLQPVWFSRRGIDAAGEFRYLTRRQRGSVDVDYLPHDSVTGGERRRVRFTHRAELPAGWRVDLDAEDVSDAQYFEDFGQGPEGTSTAFLERIAQVSYRDEFWRLRGELQHFQTIDRELALSDRPYAQLPRLQASGNWYTGPQGRIALGLDAELVNFDRPLGVTGWRFDAAPAVGLDLTGAGYYVRPSAGLRYTGYALNRTTAGQDDTPRRSLPFASLDAGLVFERFSGASGQRRITLEPRLLYLYTPFRNQSALPVFDTALPDLNFVQLFRSNRYVGADRVSDANQVSAGLTTKLFDSRSGARYLSATIGQTYYFDTPRVALPGETPRSARRSDLVAELALTAYRNWNLGLGMQWDPQASRQERSQLRLQYHPDDEHVVNLGYRFQRDRLKQGEASGVWPVSRNWNLFARLVYDLDVHQTLERFAGVEYRSCCWRVRAVARRFVSSRTGERDNGYYLQLELNGLSSVGSSADTFLEQAIRGYSTSSVSH